MSFTHTFQESDAGKTFRFMFSAGYEYNHKAATAYPATEEEKTNSKKTFLNDSNISWSCY